VALRTELSMMRYQGTRRYGSEEAPPIDWLVPPSRRANAHSDAALTEIFAYHAVSQWVGADFLGRGLGQGAGGRRWLQADDGG